MFANFQNLNPNKDAELTDVQSDSISSIKFSPKANYIVAGSWDNIVRSGCLRTCLSLALSLSVCVSLCTVCNSIDSNQAFVRVMLEVTTLKITPSE